MLIIIVALLAKRHLEVEVVVSECPSQAPHPAVGNSAPRAVCVDLLRIQKTFGCERLNVVGEAGVLLR